MIFYSYKIYHKILSVSRVTGTFQNISANSAMEKREARSQGMRLRNAWNVMKFSRVSAFYRVRFPLGNRRRETGQQMQFLTLCGNRVVKLGYTTSGTVSSTMKSSSWHASRQLVEKYSWFLSRWFRIQDFYHSRVCRDNLLRDMVLLYISYLINYQKSLTIKFLIIIIKIIKIIKLYKLLKFM